MSHGVSPCCVKTVDRWYRSFLAVRGGHHSEGMTRYFLEANRDLVPLFADMLGNVEFRVAASKSIGQARMQPLACAGCGSHVALVILGLPFMLMLFRIQVIFHSMIDNWEIIPEGNGRYRERIKWLEPGDFQVRQLRLGLDMYLGEKEVTLEGMRELLAPLDHGSPESKRVFLEAMRVAESWGVAHEFFHVCTGPAGGEQFPQFKPLADSYRDALDFAGRFCEQVCAHNKLEPDIRLSWLEEFQADLMACKLMLIAIADNRYRDVKGVEVPQKDARFQAARIVLNGVAAALDAVYWVDVHRASPVSSEDARTSSHPPHFFRWNLMKAYVKGIARLYDDTVSSNTEVMARLSRRLSVAYKRAAKKHHT